jgi:hypothetical protein
VQDCERYLWSDQRGAKTALNLRSQCGFTDDTIRAARLGLQPDPAQNRLPLTATAT